MIIVSSKKKDGVWYNVATQNDQILFTYISFGEQDLKHIARRLLHDAPFQIAKRPDQLQAKVLDALEEIFGGKDKGSYGFKINMNNLSSHRQKVLNCTRMVPVGYVTTYGALSKAAGGSARSVGHVQATNPVPLLIPCHRVVCADLTVGGYGGGPQVKLEILGREERGYEKSKTIAVEGKELALFPAEWVKPNRESF
jgi:O-6-methylguanine DNA methyltransferase